MSRSTDANYEAFVAGKLAQVLPVIVQRRLFDEEGMRRFGAACHNFTYAQSQADIEVIQEFERFWNTSRRILHPSLHYVADLFLSPHTMRWAYGLARWADQGFPKVTMHASYAAGLMLTRVAPDLVEDVRSPWRAFVIELPEGILCVQNGTGPEVIYRRILVQRVSDPERSNELLWNVLAPGTCDADPRAGSVFVKSFLTTRELVLDYGTSPLERRRNRLISRVVFGTCLAMSDPGSLHEKKVRVQRWRVPKKLRPEDLPAMRTFVLGRPLNVDFRSLVREYGRGAMGRSHEVTVQSLVRGHWKRQAHGPKSIERRIIHIEPYWRGPFDERIVVRTHRLGGPPSSEKANAVAPEPSDDDI